MALAQMLIELIAIYFHSFEIFNIQIGKMTFCEPEKANPFWIILKH
jgi:hypothetical protein